MTDEQIAAFESWWEDPPEGPKPEGPVSKATARWIWECAIIAASASAQPACVECGGPLQWRCPSCRIAQSAAVADPPPQSTADTVRVPREPTVTMIKAGSDYAHPEGIWAAMIAAAPKDTTP